VIVPSSVKEISNTCVTLHLNIDELLKSAGSISDSTLVAIHEDGWFSSEDFVSVEIDIDADYYVGVFYSKTFAQDRVIIDSLHMFDRLVKNVPLPTIAINASVLSSVIHLMEKSEAGLNLIANSWSTQTALQGAHQTVERSCGEYVDSAILSVISYVAVLANSIDNYANSSDDTLLSFDWSHLIIDTEPPGNCAAYCYTEKVFAGFTVIICFLLVIWIFGFSVLRYTSSPESDTVTLSRYWYTIIVIGSGTAAIFLLIQIIFVVFSKIECMPFQNISSAFDVSILTQEHISHAETSSSFSAGSYLLWTAIISMFLLWVTSSAFIYYKLSPTKKIDKEPGTSNINVVYEPLVNSPETFM